ncbi:MAG: heavy-metal-associated domain-containing protein [Aestuariivirga sp.]|nr:heavy-metal-associated domain-containing protein [Aestuariivirga sp.]
MGLFNLGKAQPLWQAGLHGDPAVKFNVPDMTCGHCVATITRAVKAVDPAAEVKADLAGKTVTVETAVPAEAVARALDRAGYPNSAM